MKSLLFFLSLAAVIAAEPAKVFPLVQLKDGRVLKKVTLANPNQTGVLLRQAGGESLFVRYEFLPEVLREAAEAIRPGGPRPKTTAEGTSKMVEFSGQIYVTTRGAGAYKFSGVRIYVFPLSAWDTWANTNLNPVELPRPLAQTTSDGDGRFTLKVPEGVAGFVFAQATRSVGGKTEHNEWHVPLQAGDPVLLNNTNLHGSFRPVKIE